MADNGVLERRDQWMICVLMVGGFLGSLSQNMLTSALTPILRDFQVNAVAGQQLTTISLLVLGVISVLTATLFQRVRTKWLLEGALLVFSAGCLMAYFAPSFPVLLVARAVQAAGSGVLIPVLQMVLIHLYPADQQGRALGLTGIVVGFAPAVGPSLAGVLVDQFGWRSLFLLLMTATLLVAAAGTVAFRQVGEKHVQPLRLPQAILYGVSFITIMEGITHLGEAGASLSRSLLLLGVGLVLLGIFVTTQLRGKKPLLHLDLFSYRSMRAGVVLTILTYTVMTSGTVLVPLYIQSICGHSATVSGLVLLPGALCMAALSPIAGRLTDRFGIRGVVMIGLVCLLVGSGAFALVDRDTSVVVSTLYYSLRSVGLAFLMMPLNSYAIHGMPLGDADHGMAIVNSFRQIGGSISSTLLVLAATALSAGSDLDLHGFNASAVISALIVLAALLFWWRRGGEGTDKKER